MREKPFQRGKKFELHRRHGGRGDFTEASGFSVHLRVLRVCVVNKVLEFFSSLASRNSSVLVMASGLTGVYVAPLAPLRF